MLTGFEQSENVTIDKKGGRKTQGPLWEGIFATHNDE